MTIDFYYTDGSIPCRFVQLLAKNLNIELNPIHFDLLDKKEQLHPNFLKMNPQHCVPTIIDGDFILWESSVIATYFVQQYSDNTTLYPKDLKKRSVVDQRLYFSNTILRQRHRACYFPILVGIGVPGPEKLKKLQEAYEVIEAMLDKNEYVAGDCLTLADYSISTIVATSVAAGFDLSGYKNLEKWLNKIRSTVPSFQEFNSPEVIHKIFENYRKNNFSATAIGYYEG